MAKTSENPLFVPQREKAGAQTFSKYAYQYHWGLYRVLQEHKGNREYALFVEVHEDVVLADSLDAVKARFEFNQVKTNATKFTIQGLTKLKNGSSVLGKLVSNTKNERYAKKLKSLNLVNVKGFSLPLKTDGLNLKKICLDDLHADTNKALLDAISQEISIKELPKTLNFLLPDLSDQNFQDLIVAEIANTVSSLFVGHLYEPKEIYRVLYDDITRKGMTTFDIRNWEEFLEGKALTSDTVTRVINEFTDLKDEASIKAEFAAIATELGLNAIASKSLQQSFNRYRRGRIATRSTLQIDTTREISTKLRAAVDSGIVNMNELLEHVSSQLPKGITKQFTTEDETKAAIIYEWICLE